MLQTQVPFKEIKDSLSVLSLKFVDAGQGLPDIQILDLSEGKGQSYKIKSTIFWIRSSA